MQLTNKVAIATGGNRGIGKAIVIELAKQGANVAVDYISHPDATEELEKQIVALGDLAIGVEAVGILARQHRHHAGHRFGFSSIDRAYARVRVWAAQKLAFDNSWNREIGNVLGVAGDLAAPSTRGTDWPTTENTFCTVFYEKWFLFYYCAELVAFFSISSAHSVVKSRRRARIDRPGPITGVGHGADRWRAHCVDMHPANSLA